MDNVSENGNAIMPRSYRSDVEWREVYDQVVRAVANGSSIEKAIEATGAGIAGFYNARKRLKLPLISSRASSATPVLKRSYNKKAKPLNAKPASFAKFVPEGGADTRVCFEFAGGTKVYVPREDTETIRNIVSLIVTSNMATHGMNLNGSIN